MGISSLTCGPPRQQVREQRREIKSHRQTEGESTEMEDKDEGKKRRGQSNVQTLNRFRPVPQKKSKTQWRWRDGEENERGGGERKEPIVSPSGGKEFPWPGTNKSKPPCDGEMKGERDGWRGRGGRMWRREG